MNRIIVFLLLLSCFKISSAEELGNKEQQLAWDFIYDRMLTHQHLPKIFNTDIYINIKGNITNKDSIIINEVISQIQKVIPYRKIQLSNKKGNLEINLHDKVIRARGMGTSSSTSRSLDLPENMTEEQKKKCFHYALFNGLAQQNLFTLTYRGLEGCVFSEKNFETITYSKFDLFILKKLYSKDFSTQLINNLPSGIKETAWNSIRAKFMGGESKENTIYQYEIAIKLKGIFSTADSLCMAELIDDLDKLFPNKNIFLTNTISNLDFVFNEPGVIRAEKSQHKFGRVKNKEIKLTVKNDSVSRRKKLYFELYRSLVTFSRSSTESSTIRGCVFDEDSPEKITFHPVDSYILQQLYSSDFHKQFKKSFLSQHNGSKKEYYLFMYPKQIKQLSTYLGIIAAFLILLVFARKLKSHEYKFKRFFKQGLIVLFAFISYYTISTYLYQTPTLKNFVGTILVSAIMQIYQGLLVIVLLYFLEKLLLKQRKEYSYNLLIPFISTAIIPTTVLISVPLIMSLFTDVVIKGQVDLSIAIYFALWMIFASIRTLFIYLRMTSENIIREKDLQLARLSELHKQAELQSLQSKINPHFLYNALNSIASLSTVDGKKTEKMALALSDFFKYSMNKEQKEMVSLKEEIESIETYLTIEKVRFGDRLNFTIHLPKELENITIPQFIIQPLIENSVKHGISKIVDSSEIKLEVSSSTDNLVIKVFDNGPDFSNEPNSGYGLQSIQEKLSLIYGDKSFLSWHNTPRKHALVSLPLNTKS